jgi:vesicle coat complex subunit
VFCTLIAAARAGFVGGFKDEPVAVQLQLLTAVVKVFLKRPEEAKEMVTQVLTAATESVDNPDLRDRGYIYWCARAFVSRDWC